MCVACGECFSNWDRILKELKTKTEEEVLKANQVKVTGATGAYSAYFQEMEREIEEIKTILKGASISNEELEAVQNNINDISEALKSTTTELDGLDSSLASTKRAIDQVLYNLPNFLFSLDTKLIIFSFFFFFHLG